MAKAQVGDLIRVIDRSVHVTAYKVGGIYEVIGHHPEDEQIIVKGIDDRDGYLEEHEYEIFRKADEEDDGEEITAEHFDGTADVSDAQLTQANRIRSACSELAELLVRKDHDYGDSFAKQYEKYGLMSALIRMDDKLRRLETLQGAENQAQVDESTSDTLLDLAGYALLSYVEQTKNK